MRYTGIGRRGREIFSFSSLSFTLGRAGVQAQAGGKEVRQAEIEGFHMLALVSLSLP